MEEILAIKTAIFLVAQQYFKMFKCDAKRDIIEKCIPKDKVLGKSYVAKDGTTPKGGLGKGCKMRSSSRKLEEMEKKGTKKRAFMKLDLVLRNLARGRVA